MNLDNFDLGLLMVFLFGGIIRNGTPYLFVSLGECVTERTAVSTSASRGRYSWGP